MIQLKHLSVTVQNPQRCAEIVAAMTGGQCLPFRARYVEGAWICLWNPEENELIEFLPDGYLLRPSETGAVFEKIDVEIGYNATHVQVKTDIALSQIKAIAEENHCRHYLRERFGGPLYEVWVEEQFLVEFISDEISHLS